MSWDATLYDDRGHCEGNWSYTHNTSWMIYAVLDEAGFILAPDTQPCTTFDRETAKWIDHPSGYGTIAWWQHLNGLEGPVGAAYLDLIIRGLEADPERFRTMNPENGWGNYDDLVKVLTEMRNSVPEWPTKWDASG